MCGIAGIVTNKTVTKERVEQMLSTMQQRGPDASGITLFEHNGQEIALGHRRLKIIDLSNLANQPMSSADKSIEIVYNGEVYNFKELRRDYLAQESFKSSSDTEVILKLYQKLGRGFVTKLRGMFALAIYDKQIGRLLLCRDHLGKKPLYYRFSGQELLFSSTLAAIQQDETFNKQLNREALTDYLYFGYLPGNSSIWSGVYKLAPASLLEYDGTKMSIERFWQPEFRPKLKISEREALQKSEELLREAVALRMVADVPLGVFLSGGIDSGLIVAMMAGQSQERIKSFSIGFEQSDFSELQQAKLTARRYNTDHTEFIVTPKAADIFAELLTAFEEPYADPSQIPMYYLSKLTAKKVKVALNGDGGDENFGGYERYLGMLYQHYYRLIPSLLRRGWGALLSLAPENTAHISLLRRLKWLNRISLAKREDAWLEQAMLSPAVGSLLGEKLSLKGQSAGQLEQQQLFSAEGLDIKDRMLNADINSYLPQDLLVKADRSTMWHSLEARFSLFGC